MRWVFFFLLCGIIRSAAGPAGEVALSLMNGLQDPGENAKTLEGLAISRFCGPRKRESIEQNWKSRASWATEGKYSFELLDEKVDGDLAGVLIGATKPDNPDLATVVALGVVKQDDGWKVAPVEGSFDNTGLGFDLVIRKRILDLEVWMAREQVGASALLLLSELRKFKKSMDGAVPEKDLRGFNKREALESFLQSAVSGDFKAMVVWQGYFERDEFPAVDWEKILQVTRDGIENKDRQKVWRLLTSRKVMRVVFDDKDTDDEEPGVLVGFLSSFETGTMGENVNPVRFEMKKTKAGWRVVLPDFFALANEGSRSFRNARNQRMIWEDRNSVRRMFRIFEERHPKLREKEAKAVVDGLLADLEAGHLPTFLRRHYRFIEKKKEDEGADAQPDDPELLLRRRIGRRGRNEPDEKRMALYLEAIKWWATSHGNREYTKAEVNGIYVEGNIALSILSLPPTDKTWKPVYAKVWLAKREDGWIILPGRESPLGDGLLEEDKASVDKLLKRYDEEKEKLAEAFMQDVLKVVELDAGKGQAVGEKEAIELAKAWRETARNAGMLELLKLSAVRKRPEVAKDLLKIVKYQRIDAAAAKGPEQFLGTKASGRFRGVSIASIVGQGGEMKCPLAILVPIDGGYRVLVDIELPLETNKGISLILEGRLEELSDEMSKEDFAAIKELHEWHQKTSRPVWEKWNREKDERDQ